MAHVDPGFPLVVGDRVTVGHKCTLHGCTLQDDCIVGMGSTVMNGAVIGQGAVVGACSVVLEGTVVPPFSLVVGSPATVMKTYARDEALARARENAKHYVARAGLYRRACLPVAVGGGAGPPQLDAHCIEITPTTTPQKPDGPQRRGGRPRRTRLRRQPRRSPRAKPAAGTTATTAAATRARASFFSARSRSPRRGTGRSGPSRAPARCSCGWRGGGLGIERIHRLAPPPPSSPPRAHFTSRAPPPARGRPGRRARRARPRPSPPPRADRAGRAGTPRTPGSPRSPGRSAPP